MLRLRPAVRIVAELAHLGVTKVDDAHWLLGEFSEVQPTGHGHALAVECRLGALQAAALTVQATLELCLKEAHRARSYETIIKERVSVDLCSVKGQSVPVWIDHVAFSAIELIFDCRGKQAHLTTGDNVGQSE